jgi:hypothetical protein
MSNISYTDGNAYTYFFPQSPTPLDSSYPQWTFARDHNAWVWSLLNNTPDAAVWIRVQHPFGVCKTWVNFDGADGTINDSFGVSSVVRNSTGNYTITFLYPMLNTNYVTIAQAFDIGNFTSVIAQTTTTTQIRASNIILGATQAVNPAQFCIAIYGQ